jgi:hypothetical protein
MRRWQGEDGCRKRALSIARRAGARAVQPGAPGKADCGYQDLTDRAVLDLPAELGGVEVLGLLSRQSQVGVLPQALGEIRDRSGPGPVTRPKAFRAGGRHAVVAGISAEEHPDRQARLRGAADDRGLRPLWRFRAAAGRTTGSPTHCRWPVWPLRSRLCRTWLGIGEAPASRRDRAH